jgi:hypothetical protein
LQSLLTSSRVFNLGYCSLYRRRVSHRQGDPAAPRGKRRCACRDSERSSAGLAAMPIRLPRIPAWYGRRRTRDSAARCSPRKRPAPGPLSRRGLHRAGAPSLGRDGLHRRPRGRHRRIARIEPGTLEIRIGIIRALVEGDQEARHPFASGSRTTKAARRRPLRSFVEADFSCAWRSRDGRPDRDEPRPVRRPGAACADGRTCWRA